MTRSLTRRTRGLAVLCVGALVMLIAGCGLGTAGGRLPEATLAGPLAEVESLDGAEISVGSKNFSENIILGKMVLILLKASGAEVTDLTNIPGSTAARQAQLEGQIDAMWEYSGTGWVNYLGHNKGIRGEREQYTAVRDEDLEKNDMVWLEPAPLNNQYAFAVTQKVAKDLKVSKLSDIADLPVAERTFCVESEFVNRPDGLGPMLKAYKIPRGKPKGVPEKNLRYYQTGTIYDATAGGKCNFGEVFTTDGRILALNLKVLEDDLKVLPNYNVSLVVREEIAKKYPQIQKLVDPVSEKLTNELMLRLNQKVDVDGEEPVDVAYDWLKKEGFIK